MSSTTSHIRFPLNICFGDLVLACTVKLYVYVYVGESNHMRFVPPCLNHARTLLSAQPLSGGDKIRPHWNIDHSESSEMKRASGALPAKDYVVRR